MPVGQRKVPRSGLESSIAKGEPEREDPPHCLSGSTTHPLAYSKFNAMGADKGLAEVGGTTEGSVPPAVVEGVSGARSWPETVIIP